MGKSLRVVSGSYTKDDAVACAIDFKRHSIPLDL